MTFSYRKISLNQYGPVVPISLKGATWVKFNAFVDTGADYSVFHSKVANMLGLDLEHGEKRIVMVGDGDSMVVYLHRLRVRFADAVFIAKVAFSTSLGASFNLMGRGTFFELFQFCFNDRARILRVTRL